MLINLLNVKLFIILLILLFVFHYLRLEILSSLIFLFYFLFSFLLNNYLLTYFKSLKNRIFKILLMFFNYILFLCIPIISFIVTKNLDFEQMKYTELNIFFKFIQIYLISILSFSAVMSFYLSKDRGELKPIVFLKNWFLYIYIYLTFYWMFPKIKELIRNYNDN